MTLADLHQAIVEKARAAGLRQCKTDYFILDTAGNVKACCELGLLMHAERCGWISSQEKHQLRAELSKHDKCVSHRNDIDGWTWDDFTEALRRGEK